MKKKSVIRRRPVTRKVVIRKPASPQKIPEKFCKHGQHPVVFNVGDLKRELALLPDTLRVESTFGKAAQLVVYNHGLEDEHLGVVEKD